MTEDLEIEVRLDGCVVGWVSDNVARDVIRKQEGTPITRDGVRYLHLYPGASSRVRALCNTSARSALSTIQHEDVYQGKRTRNPEDVQPDVTGSVFALRKATKSGAFKDWGDTETFRKNRFDPDRKMYPLFRTEAEYRASLK